MKKSLYSWGLCWLWNSFSSMRNFIDQEDLSWHCYATLEERWCGWNHDVFLTLSSVFKRGYLKFFLHLHAGTSPLDFLTSTKYLLSVFDFICKLDLVWKELEIVPGPHRVHSQGYTYYATHRLKKLLWDPLVYVAGSHISHKNMFCFGFFPWSVVKLLLNEGYEQRMSYLAILLKSLLDHFLL